MIGNAFGARQQDLGLAGRDRLHLALTWVRG
jgi:hypothetical protein